LPEASWQKQLDIEAVMVFALGSLYSQDSTIESTVSQGGTVRGFRVALALACACAVESFRRTLRDTTWIARNRILKYMIK
jgi:hypothetical protein